MKYFEIQYKEFPEAPDEYNMAVIQPYETAAIAAREGMAQTRKYDPRAVLVGVREVPDPRGQVEEAPPSGFYARDAETGEWEQI